jgi:hypothetical protein
MLTRFPPQSKQRSAIRDTAVKGRCCTDLLLISIDRRYYHVWRQCVVVSDGESQVKSNGRISAITQLLGIDTLLHEQVGKPQRDLREKKEDQKANRHAY